MLFAGKQKKENFWDGPMMQTHFLVEVCVHSINPKDFFFLTKEKKNQKSHWHIFIHVDKVH